MRQPFNIRTSRISLFDSRTGGAMIYGDNFKLYLLSQRKMTSKLEFKFSFVFEQLGLIFCPRYLKVGALHLVGWENLLVVQHNTMQTYSHPSKVCEPVSTDKGTHACVCQREFLSLFGVHNLFKRWRWKCIFSVST